MSVILTAIIPLYNGQNFIAKTIGHVLELSTSKEIIIIDDGSDDSGGNIAEKLAEANSEIKYYKKKNGGIADARNYGLRIAQGKYIIFVDQDDVIIPDTIDSAVVKIEESNVDAVFWSTNYLKNGKKKSCDSVYESIDINKNEISNSLIVSLLRNKPSKYISYMGHLWSGLYKKNIIEKFNMTFFSYINYEDDYLFVLEYLRHANMISFIKETGYLWLVNKKSFSHTESYVKSYLNKSIRLRDYLVQFANSIDDIEKNEKEMIRTYQNQGIILKSLRNCSMRQKIDKNELYNIMKYIKNEGSEELSKKYEYDDDIRFSILFLFVKYGRIKQIVKLMNIYYRIRL